MEKKVGISDGKKLWTSDKEKMGGNHIPDTISRGNFFYVKTRLSVLNSILNSYC